MSLIKDVSNKLFFTPLNNLWSPTRPLTVVKTTFKGFGRSVTIGVGLTIVGVALKTLALTPVGPALGAVSFLATLGSFPPALLITCAVVTTIASGILVSFLIESYAV